jgi:asparagine synthetase B (glutamine-hydrolysing)
VRNRRVFDLRKLAGSQRQDVLELSKLKTSWTRLVESIAAAISHTSVLANCRSTIWWTAIVQSDGKIILAVNGEFTTIRKRINTAIIEFEQSRIVGDPRALQDKQRHRFMDDLIGMYAFTLR